MFSSVATRARRAAVLVPITSLALVAFLGATATGSIYLRIPNVAAAPAVTGLSYDAVATVPERANTPAALLPVDTVEGSMTLTYAATSPRIDTSTFKNVSRFTVVQLNDNGAVTQRTAFVGVTIKSIAVVAVEDGSSARKIVFRAQKVIVTNPTV